MTVADVSASMFLQGATSEYEVDEAQRLWLNGVLFGDNIPAERYNESSNFTTVDDLEAQVVRNVKYISPTSAEVDLFLGSTYYGQAAYGESEYGLLLGTIYGRAKYGLDPYDSGLSYIGKTETVNLPIPADSCQLRVHIESTELIVISNARFYAYDGIDDVNLYKGIEFRAAEGGVSSAWVEANGSSQALVCSGHSAAFTHDFYIAVSASPASTGDKQGKIKFVFTYTQS